MDGLWKTDGVFCVNLSGFVTRQQALAAGFTWLAPILTHDPAANANQNEIITSGSAYRREGWRICGWGTYGQSDTPENDAKAAAKIARDLGLDGWIANGEAWAEGAHSDASSRFIGQWQKEGSPCPLAVSCLSSDTASFARAFDYRSWLQIGSVIMPQVYGNEHPGYTVGACLGMLEKAHVPQSMLNLTFGTYSEPVPYADYQGWSGPRTVYVGDRTEANGWPRLSRAAARPNTPPEEEPVKNWWEKPYPKATRAAYDGPLPFPLYPPDAAPKQSPDSPLVTAVKRAVSRGGRWPWQTFDDTYSNGFAHGTSGDVGKTGVAGFQRQAGIDATGWLGAKTFDALNWALVPAELEHAGEPLLDTTAVDLIRKSVTPPDVPDLGPITPGGKSVLEQDLTHATDGIPLFPAFDDAFSTRPRGGVAMIAPEKVTVDTKLSSSKPGLAFYCTGESSLRYWFAHLDRVVPLGTVFAKGAFMARTCDNTISSAPHGHCGINAEAILGPGKQFDHHTDYSHGAPTVGEQLADALL